ncbi:MAG: hypothetical protein LAO31_00880 [Acidobacteriia bacterium]|nr:hypothetical protein [Terriglobia bacterium]
MRIKLILALALLGLLVISTSMPGQTFWTHKDLVFGQVAAGGGYETVINATNRGTLAYSGTMYLFTGEGQQWNPTVNGTPVSNGAVSVSIPPGVTRSFHITVNGGVQAGMALIMTPSAANDNFLEGNLTYFVHSGSSVIDSIGVPPSNEFYLSTVAFEDFSTIALALNNGTADPYRIAQITLRLFNENNLNVATKGLILGSVSRTAMFLSEYFPGTTLGRGRLEISTPFNPIFGTALTLVNNQFSSLPLAGSPRAYRFTTDTPAFGITTEGDASLWADGVYVRGYVRFTSLNGSPLTSPETYFLAGRLTESTLRVSFFADSNNVVFGGTSANVYIRIVNFAFSASSLNDVNDIFVVTWVDPTFSGGTYAYGTTRTGTMTMNRTN